MQPIRPAFTRAAGDIGVSPRVGVFSPMVLAVAILDDSDRREEQWRKKRSRPQQRRKLKSTAGPQVLSCLEPDRHDGTKPLQALEPRV